MKRIHTLVRTGIVGSRYRGVFEYKKATNHVRAMLNIIDLYSCLYHLVQTARFRAKDYLSRGVVLV